MKKIICILCVVLIVLLFPVAVLGEDASGNSATSKEKYVADFAQVLTEEECNELNNKLIAFSKENKFDLVILTCSGVASDQFSAVADDFFDNNGFGYGKNRDGALLLVNIGYNGSYTQGNSWISTCGKGVSVFDDETIHTIGNRITPYLRNCEYYGAFNEFVELSREKLDGKTLFSYKDILVIVLSALIVGIIGAVCYTMSLKKQLKTVDEARDANNYLVADSLHIDNQRDTFLFFTVTKTPRMDNKTNGSGTHTSSSGTSHGGGGF